MKNYHSWQKILLWVSLFSMAMGFLESSVVVYLRAIYFPAGFSFPLAPMDTTIAITELTREAATLIMLLCIGFIAGKNRTQCFACFIYSFAIWDIFYYIFLKVILDWPESFMTWDVLFLIPLPWTGPVIAPVIVSFTMISCALPIIIGEGENIKMEIYRLARTTLITGSLIVILAFVWDYSAYILKHFTLVQILISADKSEIVKGTNNYVPHCFNWFLFVAGETIIFAGILMIVLKSELIKRYKRLI
jgi:hypothetical protein